jgi:hypothetical protein
VTLTELIQRVSLKLDENTAYYPRSDIVLSGINPAMRLLAMMRAPLPRRVAATLGAERVTIDLREDAPRCWKLRRVVLGDITSEDPSVSGIAYRSLDYASLAGIAWQRTWFLKEGTPTHYWRFGGHWLGIYKRPVVATTITLIFDALPLPYTVDDITNNGSLEPELGDIWHSVIADVAFALLIIREGVGETEKAQSILSQTFGAEKMKGLRRVLYQQQGGAQ